MMVLPTKRLHQSRALLSVGGEIISLLHEPKTVSRLWTEVSRKFRSTPGAPLLTYDWFILALDMLFAMDGIRIEQGLISKRVA